MAATKSRRFSERRVAPNTPDGQYHAGIWDNEIASLLGQIFGYWPHVEERMIDILRDLLGDDHNMPTRQIFRSIRSNKLRREMMTAILEKSALNRKKGAFYDDVLATFGDLNTRRNGYVHGLWFTYERPIPEEGFRIFLCEQTLDHFHFFDSREVQADELHRFFEEMRALSDKIVKRRGNASLLAPEALPETLPRPRVQRNKKAYRLQAKAAKRARPPQS
jgi:hypothetical protein